MPTVSLPDAVHTDWRMPRPLRRATRAVIEALFADDDGPPPQARVEWTLDDIEDFLARSGPGARTIFQASMLALTTLAPLTIGRPLPLFVLNYRTRAEAIERFERTPLGLAVLGAKAMLCIVYYEHPDSQKEIGFDGLCKEDFGTKGSGERSERRELGGGPRRGSLPRGEDSAESSKREDS